MPDRFIEILVEHELLLTRNRKEGEHVAGGERSHVRFLRVDIFWIAEISRRGRSRHFVAAVKFPSVIARIFLILERRIAALPGESHCVFGHTFT